MEVKLTYVAWSIRWSYWPDLIGYWSSNLLYSKHAKTFLKCLKQKSWLSFNVSNLFHMSSWTLGFKQFVKSEPPNCSWFLSCGVRVRVWVMQRQPETEVECVMCSSGLGLSWHQTNTACSKMPLHRHSARASFKNTNAHNSDTLGGLYRSCLSAGMTERLWTMTLTE